MDKREMVKALNRIYLVLELSESVHAQIEHGDDWENQGADAGKHPDAYGTTA